MITALYRFFTFCLSVYALVVLALTVIYLVIPPVSTVMMLSALSGHGMHRQWIPLKRVSPAVIRSVIVSEDARFCEHYGIDWAAITKNIKQSQRSGHAPKGASTITMQVAKNLYLWNGRSWLRKVLEAPTALYIDLVWPKKRIMEVYLNIAQWGDGVFGIEEAARRAYGISASRLSADQAAMLAVVLPDPEGRSARHPGSSMVLMASTVRARAVRSGSLSRCVLR